MRLKTNWKDRLRSDRGQGMVEYGLIIGLVVVVVLGALTTFGNRVIAIHDRNANVINNVATTGHS